MMCTIELIKPEPEFHEEYAGRNVADWPDGLYESALEKGKFFIYKNESLSEGWIAISLYTPQRIFVPDYDMNGYFNRTDAQLRITLSNNKNEE